MRKIVLCMGLSLPALTVGQAARAQFAPDHSSSYLDSRRETEQRHQTLARMLMTMGMDPDEAPSRDVAATSPYIPPARRFEPEEPMPSDLRRLPPRQASTRMSSADYYGLSHDGRQSNLPLPAVIQVNREVALSVIGGWSDMQARLPHMSDSSAKGSERSWAPGFRLDAATMFDLDEIRNVFVAVHFTLRDGNTGYRGRETYYDYADGSSQTDKGRTHGHNLTTDTRAEIGKGIMINDSFMITPAIQAGYRSWNRSIDLADSLVGVRGSSGNAVVGITMHFDYAPTEDFVIRGQIGWAEMIGARIHHRDTLFGKLSTSTRPEWTASLGTDYRILQTLHWVAGVDYAYDDFGQIKYSIPPVLRDTYLHAKTHTHYVTFHTGLAYAF